MRTATLALLAVLAAVPLLAAPYSDFYIIPAASHTTGANGTLWISDVALQNFQAAPLTVSLLFIESGQETSENVDNLISTALPDGDVTIPAGGSVLLEDVLDGFEGRSNGLFGALIVTADQPFAVTSRAYSTADGGTIGQTVPPVQDFIENTLGDTNNALAVAYVPGLISNADFRTNLGFVAGGGLTGMQVSVTLRGADGTALGTRTFHIGPNVFTHLQFPAGALSTAPFAAGAAEFRIVAGDGAVAPYASVVDNHTNSAAFVNGVFPPSSPFDLSSFTRSVFRSLLERKRAERR